MTRYTKGKAQLHIEKKETEKYKPKRSNAEMNNKIMTTLQNNL